MAEKNPAKETKRKASIKAKEPKAGFTAAERAAMKERAREAKAEARGRASRQEGEETLLAKVAEMRGSDRTIAARLHEIITATAPSLEPKTWYGMPAWAKNGKVLCFFQSAQKFDSRYATFGFSDQANLDGGAMWATSFALKDLSASEEAKIKALVKKAMR